MMPTCHSRIFLSKPPDANISGCVGWNATDVTTSACAKTSRRCLCVTVVTSLRNRWEATEARRSLRATPHHCHLSTPLHISTHHQAVTLQYSTVQYSTVRYGTVQYSTVQYSTLHYLEAVLLGHVPQPHRVVDGRREKKVLRAPREVRDVRLCDPGSRYPGFPGSRFSGGSFWSACAARGFARRASRRAEHPCRGRAHYSRVE